MSALFGHVRYGVRMLIRRPGLSVTAVVALALGIGLTTTMFSIVYAAVIRGLPYDDGDRLVALFRNRPAQGVEFMGVSIHDFEDWRAQQTSFEDIAVYFAETVNIGGTEGEPIRYLGAYASARMFEILRVQPVLGRVFRPEEDHPSTPPVMLLSYRAWQDRFQGDPAHRRPRRAGQRRDDDDRRRDAGAVRVSAADGCVAAAAHRSAGVPAGRRTGRRGHAAPGRGPAQGRGHGRGRAGRDGDDCRRARHHVSSLEPGDRRHRDAAARHLHRPAGRRHALHHARRRVRRAADRLRQRRQPAAGAHRRPQQGGGDSHRARRQPRPHRAAAARRDVGARARRRGRRPRSSPRWASTSSTRGLATQDTPLWLVATMDPAVMAFVVGLTGLSRCWPARCRRCAPPAPTSPRS